MKIKTKIVEFLKEIPKLIENLIKILLKIISNRLVKINLYIIFVEVIIIVICAGLMNYSGFRTREQNVYKKWTDDGECTQINVYFSENNRLTLDDIRLMRESYFEKDCSYIDTYSYSAKSEAKSEMGSNSFTTIYSDENYFYFHPFKLKSGSFFTAFDDNKDCAVIDEYVAWKLYNSSSNVEGLPIIIDDKTYYIKGVIEHLDDKVYEKAGLEKGMIYVPVSNYLEGGNIQDEEEIYSNNSDIAVADCYEVIIKNEVRGQALRLVEENLTETEEYKIVDYSERYTVSTYMDYLFDMENVIIHTDSIKYPFFENVTIYYLYVISGFWGIILICITLIITELFIIALYINKKYS